MAARKAIKDFILLERTATPPTSEEMQACALHICDLYNEREADLLTLQNDLFELVATCKLYERMGIRHSTSDFELAIILLLKTATDWELFLPENEIQRYEQVSLSFIKNLADYIRKAYILHHRQHGTPPPPQQTATVEASQTMPTTPQAAPATRQETETHAPREKRLRGRRAKEFKDFFLNPDDAQIITPILKKLLKGKCGRDAARIFVACNHEGWISQPTAASIEREFGISENGLTEPFRCHYTPPPINPKFPKFTENEIKAVVQQIKDLLPSQTQPQAQE